MSTAILVIACVIATCVIIPGFKGIAKAAGPSTPYFAVLVATSAALLGWSFADGRTLVILLFLLVFTVVTRSSCWFVRYI